MLVSAAVCPNPPALIPAVSQGGAVQLSDLRGACVAAVRRLQEAHPDLLVCLGAGPDTRCWSGDVGGSLHAYGVDAAFGGSRLELPLSLTVAAYLLDAASGSRCDVFQAVSSEASPQDCGSLGAELAAMADRVALLVMGDGSARRTRRSPGPFDERAEDFDGTTARALAAPDPKALLGIDPRLADEMWVAGRPAWQALAGAIVSSRGSWAGQVTYDAAVLGVGYVVVQLETH